MNRKAILTGAAGGLAASVLVLGAQAVAQTPRAVNAAPVGPAVAASPVSFADIVDRVAPAVVSVDVESKAKTRTASFGGEDDGDDGDGQGGQALPPQLRRFFQVPGAGGQAPRPQPVRGTGSGFFVSADGYIVTNNHVVEDADKITVRTSDDQTFTARLIGRDPATDLAVIKVDGGKHPFVSFEDRGKPRVGDWVVAVGNPFNLGGTATAGIVSALSRPNVSGSSYVDYMQIDAPINRGNSGGPTFDLNGRVVGVNSAIFSPTGGSVGIGFDIPADVAASVTKQLISNGKMVRGYIGATVQDVTPEIAESLGLPAKAGALIADVAPGGPSQRAGLRSGDIVTDADGTAIHSASELTRRVGLAQPGAAVKLQIRRDGKAQALTLTSGTRPSEDQLASNGAAPGRAAPRAEPETGALGLAVSPVPGGLRVDGIDPDSDAAAKGLRPGDLIEEVGGKPATSAESVTQALAAAKAAGRKQVLVRAKRGEQHIFLPLLTETAKG